MDNLSIWIGRKDKALGIQQKQKGDWEAAVNLYNCKSSNDTDPERVDVHFVNWYVANLVRLVYFRDPFIFVKPRNDNYSAFAETMEEVINYLWKELGLKQQFKKVIMSAFLMPPGWIKLGYTAKIGEDVANIDKIKEKSIIQQIKSVLTGKPEKEAKTPEEMGVLDINIKEESIFASWVPSWNLLMAPGYHQISNMPWLIEIEDVPMIDFKRNPFYKNKDGVTSTRDISEAETGGAQLKKPSYNVSGRDTDDENQIIRLYHAWDRRDQRRITFSDKAIHFEGNWPYDMEGFPYKPLIFEETLPLEQESNPYPVNAVKPILPQVIEQSNARTMMVKHRKRGNVYMIVPDDLTEEHIDQLTENETAQIIKVPRAAFVNGVVQAGVIPNLPADVYNIDAIIKQDLQMGTNMGQMMFAPMTGQRTATQAQIGQSGMQLGAQARVDTVEDFTNSVARSFAQLAWQFNDRDKVAELIGRPVDATMWPDLPDDPKERRRIIHAELQLYIDSGSTAPPKDETVDRKQILDMVSILKTIAPSRIKEGPVAKQLVKTFKFAKDADSMVVTNDDEEIQLAMKENEAMMQGIPTMVHPNDLHEVHITEHQKVVDPQNPNPLLDTHIVEHGQFYSMKTGQPIPQMGGGQTGGQSGVGQGPQEGDRRPPMKSTNPEQVRQGIPSQGSLMQSAQNMGVGSGQGAM